MKKITFALLVMFFFFVVSPVYATVRSWDVDKDHSGFYFTVDHIFSKIHGLFNSYEVKLLFDKDNPANSKLDIIVNVDSIDTNVEQRNKHLLTADFFDVAQYPTMKFTSTEFVKTGEKSYDVKGTFNIKGTDYPLMIPLTFEGVKDHPMMKGKEVTGVNGGLIIDRLKYKIGSGKFAQMGIVGKDVDIKISMELLADK